ncbi:MAG: PAS domain-containing protein, partial [Armatimonadota bacterium]
METTSVLNRGNKLIASLGALIIVIGFCASMVLSGLATSSDKVRVDQLRLSEFKSQLSQIPALVDTMILSTQLNGFDSNIVRVAEQVKALESGSVDRTLPVDWANVDRFLAGTKREIKAISVNQFEEAARIRQVQSEPAFKTAMSSIVAQNLSLNSEAKQLRQRSQTVRNATLLGAGLLVFLLVIGFYRSYEIVAQRERAQHARDIRGLRFAALVQDSTDIILVTSRKGIVTLANNACKEIWNISPRECIGKPILDILTATNQQELS